MKEKDKASNEIISFDISSFEEELWLFKIFLKKKKHSDTIIKLYPVLYNLKTYEEFKTKLNRLYLENIELLKEVKEETENRWRKIENKIIARLQEILELRELPKPITGKVSLLPIAPRFLKQRLFYFCAKSKCKIETIVHELLHFMYFMKWIECFPEYRDEKKQREFDSPFLVWHLSEIVPGIILNDEIILKELDCIPRSYKRYYEIIVNKKSVIQHIKEIYKKRKSFCEFLKKAWGFIKRNEEKILE